MVFHAVSLVHSLEQSCLSSCNYRVIFVSKKLADLWIHFIIFSSLMLFLKDTFTSQMKDHCGIQVVPSKAGPLGVQKAWKMAAQTLFGGGCLGGKRCYFHTKNECTSAFYRCLNSPGDHMP